MPGNKYGGNNSISPKCGKWSIFANQVTFILVLNTLLCVLKTTDEVWDPYRLVSLVLKSLFCKHKTTDESWNQYRLDILVQITPF